MDIHKFIKKEKKPKYTRGGKGEFYGGNQVHVTGFKKKIIPFTGKAYTLGTKTQFTHLPKDLIADMALDYDLSAILSLCLTSKRFNEVICNNRNFWINKLIRDFNIQVTDIPKDKTPKKYYEFIITKLREYKDDLDVLLIEIVETGDLGLVKVILAKDQNIDAYGSLLISSENEYLDIVKYLIENGNISQSEINGALNWVVRYGKLDVVKYLIQEKGADIYSIQDKNLQMAYKQYPEIIDYLNSLR